MDQTKRQHLIKTLNNEGMTVLLTKDYNAILLNLALLKRFDRLVRTAATVDTPLAMLVRDIDKGAALIAEATNA